LSNDEYSGTSRDLIPGSIIGYRTWNITQPGVIISHNGSIWAKNGTKHAVCLKVNGSLSVREPHRAPIRDCTCGIYAKYDPTDFHDIMPMLPHGTIIGAISAFGNAELGPRGFRAAQASILAICPLITYDIKLSPQGPTLSQFLNDVAYSYRIPLFLTMRDLVDRYPPSDVSGLVDRYPPSDDRNLFRLEKIRMMLPSSLLMDKTQIRNLFTGNWA